MIKKILLGLSLLGFTGCAHNGDTMELEGRIAMKGSSSHAYLAIKDNTTHKSYKIQNTERFDLMAQQNKNIKLKVKLIKEAVGIGFPAVVEVIGID